MEDISTVPAQRPSRSVIMYGPNGVGKTRHSKPIAAAFGCDEIHDEWISIEDASGFAPNLSPRTLYITVFEPNFMTKLPEDTLIISYDAALAVACSCGLI